MSLMTRVRATMPDKNSDREVPVSSSSSIAALLEELKRSLYERMSSDEIAAAITTNPYQARNEIKRACEQIFAEVAWMRRVDFDKNELVEELINTVFGLGPLENLLKDETITEIMVNGAQSIFFEREGKLHEMQSMFATDDQVRSLIDRIIGPLGRRIDEASPMVNARLKQGHRVNAIIPPISLDGPILTIRKFRTHTITLQEMRITGSIDNAIEHFLVWTIRARKNIAVCGGTGSGKTTLLNALSCVIPSSERIITIEDSAELRFNSHPHVVRLEARPRNAEGFGEITIRELVINALRMRPDRIIVGECRGGETLDMLQAMNTGHDGSLTTLHANSNADAVSRLATMVRYVADLPVDVVENHIASAIDMLIQITRASDGTRYVSEISLLHYDRKARFCEAEALYARDDSRSKGDWKSEPKWIEIFLKQGITSPEEVEQWRRMAGLSV